MNGRFIAGGLVAFALLFGAALWWFQTQEYYYEVTDVDSVAIAGVPTPVTAYQGIDADTSPLKMRACFRMDAPQGPPAPDATPLIAPGWFDCFDAEQVSADLAAGAARAILAETNHPYGYDRVIAVYPDGAAFMWRQQNACGAAVFRGDPAPEGCPPAPKGYE